MNVFDSYLADTYFTNEPSENSAITEPNGLISKHVDQRFISAINTFCFLVNRSRLFVRVGEGNVFVFFCRLPESGRAWIGLSFATDTVVGVLNIGGQG